MDPSPKIYFPANIRFLRERRKLSQEALAGMLRMSRNKLQALESGRTANPPLGDLLLFSEFFQLSVDSLLKLNLQALGEWRLRELLAGNDSYMKGSQLRVLAITVDSKEKENVEYVPLKAKAGYRAGYNDPEFIASLPKFHLPNLPRTGSYRVFPISGDSMLPIPDGSEIITRFVQDWTSIRPATPCILILRSEQDFLFKLVTVRPEGEFLLESLNPAYAPLTVHAAEILEIWAYVKHQTDRIPQSLPELSELRTLVSHLSTRLGLG